MLDHIAILKGISSQRRDLVEDLLKRVNLWDVRKKALGGFSGGMKQRFGIAQALIGDPKLIIVDEPTAGLDPGERNRFYNLLSEIGEQVIVILSTHIVEDVKELCPQMAIIDKGRVLFSGSPQRCAAGCARQNLDQCGSAREHAVADAGTAGDIHANGSRTAGAPCFQ
jgi:ABC-type multidrug transport system ATPase subunit